MKILPTSQKAVDAVRAAQNVNRWGRYAARRYAQKRGVPASLYRLARQLEAQDHGMGHVHIEAYCVGDVFNTRRAIIMQSEAEITEAMVYERALRYLRQAH